MDAKQNLATAYLPAVTREILVHEGKMKACMLSKASMTEEGFLKLKLRR